MSRANYTDLDAHPMPVPVQFGNLSKSTRLCIRLGVEHVQRPDEGEVRITYYRIAPGQRGAGRFFCIERWMEGGTRWTRAFSLSGYKGLPHTIREWLETRTDDDTYLPPIKVEED